MLAVYRSRPNIVTRIFEKLEGDPAALRAVLTQQDYDGRNFIMIAAEKLTSAEGEAVFDQLFNKMQKSYPEILEEVLAQENRCGQACQEMIADRIDILGIASINHGL